MLLVKSFLAWLGKMEESQRENVELKKLRFGKRSQAAPGSSLAKCQYFTNTQINFLTKHFSAFTAFYHTDIYIRKICDIWQLWRWSSWSNQEAESNKVCLTLSKSKSHLSVDLCSKVEGNTSQLLNNLF